jgi:hypothetical protein
MKTLGKKSLAYVLKVLLNILWVVQIIFFSLIFFGVIIKFAMSQEYSINKWPVILPVDSYSTQVSTTHPKVSHVKVKVEKASLSFRTQSDWRIVAIVLTGVIVGFGISLTVTYQLRKIFATLTQADPFVASNAGRIRIIGFVLISTPLVGALLDTITNQFVQKYFVAGKHSFLFRYDPELSWVFTGLVILVIAEVFRTGAKLKEEQDLTI